jgi:hypothetical protein
LFLFVFAGCKRENAMDCFKTNGHYHEETRNISAFKVLSVDNLINVKIFKGPEHKLLIKAGKNLMSNILTKVKGDVLFIENHNECNFVRGYKHKIHIDLYTPYLNSIKNLGVGTIEVDQSFEQDTLVARIESSGDIHINGKYNQIRTSTHGNGNMYLNGTANTFYVYSNGLNFVYAENLIVKDYAFIQSVTLGDCFVNASQLNVLDYSLESSGNLYYNGQPKQIKAGGNGSGKAIQK